MPISRTVTGSLLGFALGVGAATALGALRAPSSGCSPTPAVETPQRKEAGEKAPSLVGSPPAQRAPALLTIDLADWLSKGVPTLKQGQDVEPTLWQTIAASYARLGRAAEVRRICEIGLAAGGNGGDCTWPLSELPEADRDEVLKALRSAHPELVWDPLLVARVAVTPGERKQAFAAMLALFREAGPRWPAALESMARMDLGRAEMALAEKTDWVGGYVLAAADVLELAGAGDAAARWRERGTQREAEEQRRDMADLTRRTTKDPRDADAWRRQGELLGAAGDHAGARDAFRHAVEANPFDGESWEGLARLDPEGVIPLLVAAEPRIGREWVWLMLATAYLRTGHGSEAVDAVLHLRTESLDDWWREGLARFAPERALPWLEDRIGTPMYARNESYLTAYADALHAAGRDKQAWETCERIAAEGFHGLAWSRQRHIDAARLLPLIQDRQRAQPDESGLGFELAEAFRAAGRREEAVALYEPFAARGLEEASDALATLGAPGWLARLEADEREAPGDPRLCLRLAEVYRALGREEDVRAVLRRVNGAEDDGEWLIRWCRLVSR